MSFSISSSSSVWMSSGFALGSFFSGLMTWEKEEEGDGRWGKAIAHPHQPPGASAEEKRPPAAPRPPARPAAHLDEAGEDAEEPVLAVHRAAHRVALLLLLRLAGGRRGVAVHGGLPASSEAAPQGGRAGLAAQRPPAARSSPRRGPRGTPPSPKPFIKGAWV